MKKLPKSRIKFIAYEVKGGMRALSHALLAGEVARARTKHPNNAKLLAALMEEVGELAQAMLQRKPKDDIAKEAIQVACVAIRLLEEGDSDFSARRKWSDK